MSRIYILKCESDKYYIGNTEFGLYTIYNKHLYENYCEWTNTYKPVKLIESFKNPSYQEMIDVMNKYVNKFGVENVKICDVICDYYDKNRELPIPRLINFNTNYDYDNEYPMTNIDDIKFSHEEDLNLQQREKDNQIIIDIDTQMKNLVTSASESVNYNDFDNIPNSNNIEINSNTSCNILTNLTNKYKKYITCFPFCNDYSSFENQSLDQNINSNIYNNPEYDNFIIPQQLAYFIFFMFLIFLIVFILLFINYIII